MATSQTDRQYVIASFPAPIVVNETGNRQYVVPTVVVNETVKVPPFLVNW